MSTVFKPNHNVAKACICFLCVIGIAATSSSTTLRAQSLTHSENASISSVITSLQNTSYRQQQSSTDQLTATITKNGTDIDTNTTTANDSSFSPTAYTPATIDRVALKKYLEYPTDAIARHIEGRIDIIIYLNDKGEPTTVNFESMSPLDAHAATTLASAACKAIQHSTFTPATLTIAGKIVPVSSVVRMPFKFIL